jgi:acyl-CoA reductase-like NAD-dependent aldehyde dehydrogenase
MKLKIAIAAAIKAKRTWDRIPPEQRKRIAESTATTIRTHGPVVAKKLGDTAKMHGPVVAKKVSDTAKTQGGDAVRRLGQAIDRRFNRPG